MQIKLNCISNNDNLIDIYQTFSIKIKQLEKHNKRLPKEN